MLRGIGKASEPKLVRSGLDTTTNERALHPAAREAAAKYSDIFEENDKLRADVASLRHGLEVERSINQQLRAMLEHERAAKEKFQRYSVEVRSHLRQLVLIANDADAVALDAAMVAAPDAPDVGTDAPKPIPLDDTGASIPLKNRVYKENIISESESNQRPIVST